MALPTQQLPIADLHCDLLWYLSLDQNRTANDPQARCAIPQLKNGNVHVQTMAIFVETNTHSLESGLKQASIFNDLPNQYHESFQTLKKVDDIENLHKASKIGIIPAVENASAFCDESEDISLILKRFTTEQRKIGKFFYVSLTWNTENRFGGGALTKIGLKNDGKLFVDYLCERGIALDLSHASDYLAFDLLNYIEKKGLILPLIASHSNMRAIANVPRNLPDEIAKEIIKKNGLIGINFVRYFLGSESPQSFAKQLEHVLTLGGEKNICFGADFFCIEDLPLSSQKPLDVLFFPGYNQAGSYGKVVDIWRSELKLHEGILKNICYGNYHRFLKAVLT